MSSVIAFGVGLLAAAVGGYMSFRKMRAGMASVDAVHDRTRELLKYKEEPEIRGPGGVTTKLSRLWGAKRTTIDDELDRLLERNTRAK